MIYKKRDKKKCKENDFICQTNQIASFKEMVNETMITMCQNSFGPTTTHDQSLMSQVSQLNIPDSETESRHFT